MKKLKIPLEDWSVRDIFLDCIANLHDKDALAGCAELIQTDSDAYRALAPLRLAQFHYRTEFPGGVTPERLRQVYSNTFVSRERFYDKLFPKDLTDCPICDAGEPSTLDHYLPKSVVPTLAVTPCNLVPMCDRCNRRKLDQMETAPERIPFHLYFDEFSPEPWLTVRLVLGEELAAVYEVQGPDDDPILHERLKRHMELYQLRDRFAAKASGELARNRRAWSAMLADLGEGFLRMNLQYMRSGLEEADANSWRAALYRSLEENMDLLVKWLKAGQPAKVG